MADASRSLEIKIDQTGNAASGLDGLIGSLGSGVQTAAGLAVGALGLVTGAVVGIGAAAVNAWSQMDEGVDNFTTRTGITGEALDAVQESIENISESSAGVGKSLGTIGDVMGTLTSRTDATGDSLEEMASGLLKLSRITGEDAVASSELFTRALGDWGVPIEESSTLLDKLTKAHQETGVGVNDLMGKMVQFGAPLRQMGFGIDESIALFGKWEKEGVNSELVMGSLRIAAGHFAKAQGEVTTEIKGGVANMDKANDRLAKLKDQLQLATLKQGEFTDKTKESTRVQSQMKIDQLTKDISELEAAMAKGEDRTVTTVTAQKSLKESLMATFDAIKNASSETDGLAIAMEVFGARAGPDMAAAIREGRFSIEELVATLGDSEGALDDTADATLDFGDRFGIMKQKVLNSLVPVGQAIMDLGDVALDFAGPAVDNLTGWIDKVTAKYQEGGISGVTEMIKADLALLGNSISTEAQRYSQQFWSWLDDAITKAPANFALLQNTIKTEIAFAWPGIKAELDKWGPAAWDWIKTAAAQTDTSFKTWTDSIKAWVNTHPTDIQEIGIDTGNSIYDGLTALLSSAEESDKAVSTWVGSLGQSTVNLAGSMMTIGLNFATGFVDAIISKWAGAESSDKMRGAIKDALVRTVVGLNPLAIFTPVGRSAVDGIVKGFENGWGAIERAAKRAAKKAFDAAMDWLEAGSPSDKFSDEVGEGAIGGGMVQGIVRSAGAIASATRTALSPAMSVAGGGGLATAGAGSGGSAVIVNLTYAPMVSTADQFEVETKLIPLIKQFLR